MRASAFSGNTYTSRRWTDNEDHELIEGLRAGLPCRRIADNINRDRADTIRRTPVAIRRRAMKFGGITEIRSGLEAQRTISSVRNASDVATLLGMPYTMVKQLCETKVVGIDGKEQRMLKNSRTGYTQPKKRGKPWKYYVTDDALMEFLDTKEYWMLVDTSLIADTDWRDYALFAREDCGGHWIRAATLARTLGYDPSEGLRWIRRGRLSGVKVLGVWYVWSGDAQVIAFAQKQGLTLV